MNWTVIVYPFLDGDTSLTGMTNEQWNEVGTIFQRIHQVRLPPEGFESLRKETFEPTQYTRWVRAFETEHLHSRHGGRGSSRALRASWVAHQSTIHTGVTSLEKLAEVLQSRKLPYVICHADLHPANLLRDHAGHVFVIDWDEVMLAPKERDFIFIREPQASAFWEGYGQRAIDWIALTYFRWERVVQDLVEEAQQVVFRDDVGEDAKAIAAQRFDDTFAAGNNVDAAYAAAAHLPRDLSVPNTAGSCERRPALLRISNRNEREIPGFFARSWTAAVHSPGLDRCRTNTRQQSNAIWYLPRHTDFGWEVVVCWRAKSAVPAGPMR